MQIASPEKFSFYATKWLTWKQRFERFLGALDLCNKTGECQVVMLVYAMDEKAKAFLSYSSQVPMAVKSTILFFKSSRIILL